MDSKNNNGNVACRNKRTDLGTDAPLNFALTMMIDPCNLCNLRCNFCPSGFPELRKKHNIQLVMMDRDRFVSIIDQLAEITATHGKLKRLMLYKDGEPLLNKDLFFFIEYAKGKNVADLVHVTTNAVLLSESISDRLVNSGLDELRISIKGASSALFNKYCGVTIDYDEYVKQILYLDSVRGRMDLSAMYVDSDWSVEEKQLLRKRFEFLEDRLCGAVPFAWSKYDEHDFSMGAIDSSRSGISNKKVCPVPFYTICVNSDSTVSTCCVDWTHKTIVGNLEKESLYSIWKGEKLKDFQTMHLKGQRCLNEACAHCDYINFMKDNIDASAEAILKRL